MKLIQELLRLAPKKLVEGKNDLAGLIEQYTDQEKIYHFDGGRGVNNFEKIIGTFGYRNMDNFLEDNPGCLQAMVEWLGTQNNTEWVEGIKEHLPEELPE